MDTTALADFNLVAAHGGFGLAARASGRAKTTLSRHVRALEESLGLRLIEREGTAFRLTEEGRLLHARTEGPLAEVAEALRALTDTSGLPRGKLRVSCLWLSFLTSPPKPRIGQAVCGGLSRTSRRTPFLRQIIPWTPCVRLDWSM